MIFQLPVFKMQHFRFIWLNLVAVLLINVQGETATAQAPTQMQSTKDGLTIMSSVTEIIPDLTEEMIVKCMFSKSKSTHVASVVSMFLSRWNTTLQAYQELLAITSLDPQKVTIQRDVGAKVAGSLNRNGESSLSLAWVYPNKHDATKYRCTANSLDTTGHPVHSNVGLEVNLQTVDISTVVQALRDLKEWREQQMINNKAQENHLTALDRTTDRLTHDAKEDRGFLHILGRRWLRDDHKPLASSNVVIDRQQLYWFNNLTSFEEAKMSCAVTGGKVAEFDYDTLNASRNDLKAAGMTENGYWVGLTRPDITSNWVFNSTGYPVGPLVWDTQPHPSANCAFFMFNKAGFYPEWCKSIAYVLCARSI